MGDFAKSLIDKVAYLVNNIYDKDLLSSALTLNGITLNLSALTNAIGIIASALITIYAMWELNTSWATNGEISPRAVAFPIIKWSVAMTLFENFGNIKSGLKTLYEGYASMSPENKTIIDGEATKNIKALIDEGDMGTGLVFCLVALIIWLASTVIQLLFVYKAYIIALEFYVRLEFVQLALADSFNGPSSNCIRFIKGTIGLALYTLVFTNIPTICTALAGGAITDSISTIKDADNLMSAIHPMIMALVIPIAGLGALGAIRTTIKEATS